MTARNPPQGGTSPNARNSWCGERERELERDWSSRESNAFLRVKFLYREKALPLSPTFVTIRIKLQFTITLGKLDSLESCFNRQYTTVKDLLRQTLLFFSRSQHFTVLYMCGSLIWSLLSPISGNSCTA